MAKVLKYVMNQAFLQYIHKKEMYILHNCSLKTEIF